MFPEKERVRTCLESAIREMNLLNQMSAEVEKPDDFVTSLTGMVLFRACGMSLQYITESFVKIRNLCGTEPDFEALCSYCREETLADQNTPARRPIGF